MLGKWMISRSFLLEKTGCRIIIPSTDAQRPYNWLGSRIVDEQQRLETRRSALQQEQKSLESGIYQFPQDALRFGTIASPVRTLAKHKVKVTIVAEAAEIENDRWRNVIEGYLNTQKYYIIVPDHFRMLCVFDTMKRDRKLYGARS